MGFAALNPSYVMHNATVIDDNGPPRRVT